MTAPALFGRHRRHANPFTLRELATAPRLDLLFARSAPLALDVGCGMGSFVLAQAAAQPAWNVLGLEIRPHLVDGVNALARQQGLHNAAALLANASCHLDALLTTQSVMQVTVNFPDPWFKRRHHKRRVISPAFLRALLPKLLPGARLHVMTDVAELAAEIRQTLAACPALRCLHPQSPYAPTSTTGLQSEREAKHLQRGHNIYRLLFAFEAGQVWHTVAQEDASRRAFRGRAANIP